MSIFTNGRIKINFNNYFNELAIECCHDLIVLSINSFNIWLKLIELESIYDNLTISQNAGTLELINLFGAYSIKFNFSKNITSHILISKVEADSIYSNRNYILSEIKKRMEKKKIKNFEGKRTSTQLNKANKKICLEKDYLMCESQPLINQAEEDVIDTLITPNQTKRGVGK